MRLESFAGTTVLFLSCHDLAVFKAFLDRLGVVVTLTTFSAGSVLGGIRYGRCHWISGAGQRPGSRAAGQVAAECMVVGRKGRSG